MLRWTIRLLAVFAVLVLVLAIVVHVILQSDWLGGIILGAVSDKIGMEVAADEFSVGWWGTTTVEGMTVRMPLTNETLLTTDRLTVGHTVIPLLILRRAVDLDSVLVEGPELSLRQYENGRWNVQDAYARLATGLRSDGEKGGAPKLPKVAVRDATLRIIEPNDRSYRVGPLGFDAASKGQLVWLFDLEAQPVAGLNGRVLRGGDWAHEVGFDVNEVEPLIVAMFDRQLAPIRIAGRWDGRMSENQLHGMLKLEKVAVGSVALHGNLSVEAGPSGVTLQPRNLVVSEPNVGGEPVRVTDGMLRITGDQVRLEQFAARTDRLTARLEGQWDMDARSGTLSGSWTTASNGQSRQFYGSYEASVKSPEFGRKQAQVRVTAEGETSAGTWNVVASAEGAGPEWEQSQWKLSLPEFLWSRNEKRVDMAGARAQVGVTWPTIRLASLRLPNTRQTSAQGQYDAETRKWSARLEADDVSLNAWGREGLNVRFDVEGDAQMASISELRIAEGERVITAKGQLSFSEGGLQDVRLVADWPAGSSEPNEPQAEEPIGRWHLEADVTGRIRPVALEVDGVITGQNISLGKQTVPRVEVPLRANADDEQVQVATKPFELLGGQWQFTGRHDLSDELTQLSVVADDLSLEAAAGMGGLPLTSQGQAHAEMQVAVPAFDIRRAVASGSWRAEDINIPPLAAERASGKLRIADGLARFKQIVLSQGDGRAKANMHFRLDDPRILHVEADMESWPLGWNGRPIALEADGQAKLALNVAERTAEGDVRVAGNVLWQGNSLARIRTSLVLDQRTVQVQDLYAETLGGTVEGEGLVPLSELTATTARLKWQDIEPKRLRQWVPQFDRFEGTMSGSFGIERVDRRSRPPEPMRLVLDTNIAGGRFGHAEIGVCHVLGYLGKERLLIEDASLRVLNGQVNAKARVSSHVDKYFASVVADFNDLSLNQIAHVIDPNAAEYVGTLEGKATLLSSSDRISLGGEAEIKLVNSDLVNNTVISALYSTLNLQFGQQDPTGLGEVKIQFEGPSVVIPSFAYYNRGIEIRGAGQVKDVDMGSDSPIDGFAVASTRILKGINLPGIKELDRLMATFQAGAASVKVGGTIDEVEVNVVPLPAVVGSFRRLLWAQLKE